jgi:integrase
MASVFKPKGAKKYVIFYTDESGRRRKKTGATDKGVTQRIARDLENRAALRREGLIDPRDDAFAAHEARPLVVHLADWHRDMQARGKSAGHADQYLDRAGKLVALARGSRLADLEPGRKAEALIRGAKALATALGAARLSNLAPEMIQAALAGLRDAGKANQTVNHYWAALRAFLRWASDRGRLRDNPMRGVSGYNAEEDVRHARRSLSDGELARLVAVAQAGPERWGMPGSLRAMAYRLASATGLRAEELRTLAPESFRLDGPEPSVFVAASSTKNRRPADQPIPSGLARDLADWLRDKPAGSRVLPLHHDTAKAMRGDLEAAGIPYETDEGVADFHSLRAYFVSALVRTGASIKEVQTLARHAKPQTTLNHYAKVSVRDLRGAVESLPTPDFAGSEPEALAATGTDPAPTATHSATRPFSDDRNSQSGQGFAPTILGFAKPLDWETGLGGSNPPLSALNGRRRRNPLALLVFRLDHLELPLKCTGSVLLRPPRPWALSPRPSRPTPCRTGTASASPPARSPRRCGCTTSSRPGRRARPTRVRPTRRSLRSTPSR